MAKRPVDVLCIYRVKKGKEAAFRRLLAKHGPTMKKAGLQGAPPKVWKGGSRRQPGSIFIELMQWKDERSSDAAHQMPEVMAVWESMGNYTDGMEFVHLEPLSLGKA
jgi:quinol monooxygenase YgiN